MKRKILLLNLMLLFLFGYSFAQEMKVMDDGVIIPKINHLIVNSPISGHLVFDDLTNSFWYYNGTGWEEIGNDLDKDPANELQNFSVSVTGDTLYLSNGNHVIIPGISLANSIVDYDGNVYTEIEIGNQIWLSENLKTMHYQDGTLIPNITNNTTWAQLSTPALSFYNNDSLTHFSNYGILYNWFTVDIFSNGNKEVCPTGFEVPSKSQLLSLATFLNNTMPWTVGGDLKETGFVYWNSPNTGATNQTGFSGRGAGYRRPQGDSYSLLNKWLTIWTIDEAGPDNAWIGRVVFDSTNFTYGNSGDDKNYGYSIRCIKK